MFEEYTPGNLLFTLIWTYYTRTLHHATIFCVASCFLQYYGTYCLVQMCNILLEMFTYIYFKYSTIVVPRFGQNLVQL